MSGSPSNSRPNSVADPIPGPAPAPITTKPSKEVTIKSVRSLRPVSSHGKSSILLGNPDAVESPHHEKLSVFGCLKAILFASWLNVLLVCIPVGIASKYANWGDVPTFIINFVAIIPLAKLLGFATEDIALHLGETLGALLNASFGNAVELILSIMALIDGQVEVVQASLLGSILSNLLLVLGFCFVAGGYNRESQKFNQTAAQTSASLLALSCMSLLIPAAFSATAGNSVEMQTDIRKLSYGTAIILLVIYGLYLFFQLKTHASLFLAESGADDEEAEEPVMPLWLSMGILIVITVAVAICAECLVGSIGGLTQQWGISKVFVGLILLPIVGNAAEHATAVTVAMKDKMDLAIGVAVGSSMQIALFVTPVMVIVGWIIGTPETHMTLLFQPFETCVLFISVLIVNYLIQDGESNWLEGVMLICTYVVIAIAFWFYPEATP